jgi:hypothetical protein
LNHDPIDKSQSEEMDDSGSTHRNGGRSAGAVADDFDHTIAGYERSGCRTDGV